MIVAVLYSWRDVTRSRALKQGVLPVPADREQGKSYRNCEEASMAEKGLGKILPGSIHQPFGHASRAIPNGRNVVYSLPSVMPSSFSFRCSADRSMPMKVAVREILPEKRRI